VTRKLQRAFVGREWARTTKGPKGKRVETAVAKKNSEKAPKKNIRGRFKKE